MSAQTAASGGDDLPRLVLGAGFLLLVLMVLPGLAHPFVVPKESLACMLSGFTLLLIAADRVRMIRQWPWSWHTILLAPVLIPTLTGLASGGALLGSDGAVRLWSYAAFFVAVRLACVNVRDYLRLVRLATVLAGVEGVLVILQVLLGPRLFDVSALPSAKWRAFGTLGNPNWVGAYLAATLPLAWARVRSAAGTRERLQSTVVAGAIITGLTLTLSRGAWLAAAAGVGVLTVLDRRDRRRPQPGLILLAVAIGVGTAWVSFGVQEVSGAIGRTASIAGRMRMWQVTAAMISARPVLGWGSGSFAGVYATYQRAYLQAHATQLPTDLTDHPHNEYLYLAAEAGVFAAIALVAGLILAVRNAMATECGKDAAPLIAGLAALAVHALGDVPLHMPATAVLYCVLLAALFATTCEQLEPLPCRHLGPGARLSLVALAVLTLVQGSRLLFVDRHLAEAQEALRWQDAAGAERAALAGLDLEPGHGELWSIVAQARAAAGDDDGALVAVRRAQALLPQAGLSYLLADIERRRGHPQRALAELRALSETLPGLLRPRLLIGELYAESGQTAPAVVAFREVVSMPSKFAGDDEREVRARAARALRTLEGGGAP